MKQVYRPVLLVVLGVAVCYAGVDTIRGLDRRFNLNEVTTVPDLYNLDNPYDMPPPQGADPKFDCAWRKAAYDYAKKLQPDGNLKAVYEALQLSKCGTLVQSPAPSRHYNAVPRNVPALYVSTSGNDKSGDGSESKPYATTHRALAQVEVLRSTGELAADAQVAIVFRAGTYYLERTVDLTAVHSNIILQNYNDESVWLSGGKLLAPKWQPHTDKIYKADLSGEGIDAITGLRINGARGVRARFPNGNPEVTHFPEGWVSKVKAWLPPKVTKSDSDASTKTPNRSYQSMFQTYEEGIGGVCDNFTPAFGYWCSSNTEGGGASTYVIPSGMQYDPKDADGMEFDDPRGAILQSWRDAHWSSWMFEIDEYDKDTHTFRWTKGGFQDARGCTKGAEWFIENSFQLLDYPNEFFFDEKAQMLYYYYNGTGPIPADTQFVATNLKVIINAVGTQESPVENVQIRGLGFRDSAYTYMDPHGMPSGGDWSLQRSAALFFEGVSNILVDSIVVERVDGHALMLSKYARGAIVQNSEFRWIGESAMASWGETRGIDGSDGNQPRGTVIRNNMVHEIGVYNKQSSCWFQAKSAKTTFANNICMNGPRAGVNINDGFGGGNVLSENLIFNQCRESSDHSVVNSWDRMPFLTDVATGTPSLIPAPNSIHHNFLVANYACNGGAVDNDDGSSYYDTHDNFMVFGGHKSNFGGHSKHHHNNVDVYANVYGAMCLQANMPEVADQGLLNEWYVNNTCILADAGALYSFLGSTDPTDTCNLDDPSSFTINLSGNKVYAPNKDLNVKCSQKTVTFDQYKATKVGALDDSTLEDSKVLTVDDIIAMGQKILGF